MVSVRLICFDTETTGLDFSTGDRVIEIGCVEIIGREKSGNEFQTYINPEGKDISKEAQEITNISPEQLSEAPKFKDIADKFIDFVKGAELVIHNAEFDVGFINNELNKIKHQVSDIRDICTVFDTLVHARKAFPGQRNNLDALSNRLGISGYDRTHHGALLDAQILADTYLSLTGGQVTFNLAENITNSNTEEDKLQKSNLQFIKFSSNNKDELEHNKFTEMMAERREKEANR
ncbi:MAG: DNA polymerase III subunit epsilon [Amoebophilaceae bacterium TMED152]|nr:DNA polymerase III subunit epsilon [Gammaproteobacteria bacterium]RPH02196.1 MAG: DNA polymerase III subunit epsilon [Amoebophilaceae bacterium TMED152]